MKISQKKIMLFISIFLFYFIISFNIPLAGDDWPWGTQRGMDFLNNGFQGYNGRYLSNVIELLATRNIIFKTIYMSVFSTLLIYLLGEITAHQKNNNKNIFYILSLLFILFIPITIFSQTYGWLAGYVNYIPSMVFLLIFVLYARRNELNPTNYSLKNSILLFILGVITQINVEHVSLFALITGICALIYIYKKHKVIISQYFFYFIGLAIGFLTMFLNSAYTNVLFNNDPYRAIHQSGESSSFIKIYINKIYVYLFEENSLLLIVLSILLIICLSALINLNSKTSKILFYLSSFILLAFSIYFITLQYNLIDTVFERKIHYLIAILNFIYILTIFSSCIYIGIKKNNLKVFIFYIAGIILLTLPFLFLKPYGPRCAFGSYIFLVLLTLELFNYIKISNPLNNIIKTSTLIFALYLLFIILVNSYVNNVRITTIQQGINNNDKSIIIYNLPFEKYTWMSSPRLGKRHVPFFKKIYDIPDQTTLIYKNYWKK